MKPVAANPLISVHRTEMNSVLTSTRKEGETINSTGVTSGNRSEVMMELSSQKVCRGRVINGVSNPHKYLPAPQEPSRTYYVSLRENAGFNRVSSRRRFETKPHVRINGS